MKESEVVINIDENCREEKMKEEGVIISGVEYSELGGGVVGDGDQKSSSSMRKERRMSMSMSAKKPPRPPPPRGLSLDAADQKLMKEISEIIMMKRARIERIKKSKAAKLGTSSTTTFGGNLIAMLFTLVFCIVIIFQGAGGGTTTNISSRSRHISSVDDHINKLQQQAEVDLDHLLLQNSSTTTTFV